ncbi:MAG TPA: enolase C-terminal domain-like protein [Anaerohalosphaeraceae bacterium]|jgi:L-alanine-DL-glutamate epimerase-like enolase superfamily enzyme|nr:enolase C-terminal domain-like protein [Anaerohalosphaeraceae bacterium]HRT51309.1 enolase C-terminal domain-like protein [Anaerohalosphaeraceae bacterium]HRT87256.1 enolase C-terminal domain-like protein [Anaerohalosphaeraceae bacterium]
MTTIAYFAIFTIEIPLRFSVSHTLAQRRTARNILVQAVSEEGLSGWGECCPRPYVTGETLETARTDLEKVILPPMIGVRFADLREAAEALASMLPDLPRNRQAAFCAAELAVLDLVGKAFDISAGEVIGPIVHRTVRYSGIIAASDSAHVHRHAALIRLFGLHDVKVKVQRSRDQNVKILNTARRVLGNHVNLRIDANGAWSADEAIRQIERLSHFDLTAVEQPVAADDFEGMKYVTKAGLLPVVADESLCSVQDAEALIDQHAADILNLRVSKCGGLINTMRIYRKASRARRPCQLGAQVGETAILSAAGRHIATRCPALRWYEGSYGRLLLKHDIAHPDITLALGGRGRPIDRPGLGVEPDMRRITRYAVNVTQVFSGAATGAQKGP